MTKFIKLKERDYQDEILINIDNISAIINDGYTVIINGNHFQGNGVFHLDERNRNKLIAEINNNYSVV